MRFLSSRCRTVAEVLLTVAVLAYVTYDLVDRSGGGKPSAEPASAPLPASSSSSPVSSLASSKAPGARFEALSPARSANDTIICGATPAAADPWPVLPNQVMIFVGTATPPCSSTPAVMGSNNLSYAGVAVKSGGWISLQNILASGSSIAGAVGRLTMDSGSYLEAIIPANFQGSPYIVQQLPLLKSTAACPSFVGVNNTVPRCISAPALASVGAYACFLTSTPDQTTCTISLTIVGAMSSQASNFITATLGWDCSAMTQATFKQTIELVVGIPAVAILVTYWQCASIVVYFTVLGGSVAQANVALNTIYISMSVGALRTALNVISVSIGSIATPAANLSYTTMTINYPYSYPYVLPYLVPYSTSNPGLLALLTLLLIPVGVALALLLWCACRPVKKPVPAPCPCPCPCPAPYMPLPTCMPAPCPPPVMCEPMCAPMACEPMCAPLMSSGLGSPAAGVPTF